MDKNTQRATWHVYTEWGVDMLAPFFICFNFNESAYIFMSVWIFGEGGGAELGVGLMLRPRPFYLRSKQQQRSTAINIHPAAAASKRRMIAVEAAAGMVPPGRRKMSSKIYAKAAVK